MYTATSCVKDLFLCSLGLYGLPKRNGKLKDISHFDAAFFGVHSKQANTMDPQLRLMMEVAYEAIIDGGEELNKQPLLGGVEIKPNLHKSWIFFLCRSIVWMALERCKFHDHAHILHSSEITVNLLNIRLLHLIFVRFGFGKHTRDLMKY